MLEVERSCEWQWPPATEKERQDLEVVGPSAQRAVGLDHQRTGPGPRWTDQRRRHDRAALALLERARLW
jgi:hypothetical protein